MKIDKTLIYDTKRVLLSRYPSFGEEIANATIEYKTDLKYHTAATDGENIYFDPDYLASLNDDERIFLMAHELMHIKFAHAFRLLEKNGEKKDSDIWNEATDAIINANLARDGFKIKDGYINRPEALNYSAEEFYKLLLKEKESQKNNGQKSQDGQTLQDEQGTSSKNPNGDDHSLWEEAFEKHQEKQTNQDNSQNSEQSKEIKSSTKNSTKQYDEKVGFFENRQERLNKAKENLEHKRAQLLKRFEKSTDLFEKINLGDVGSSRETIDWKILLRKEIEKSETIWSQRRSIAENNYAYRLEENDIEDEAETEVMIDVSGSVDLDLVKAFLRILKPLLKHSKLRVGCFNEKFWGLAEIKSTNDIDNFVIPAAARGNSAWTEDWDLAVRSFTKKREINKLVFTDGEPCPGTMPKDDLHNENIIWLVYGNKNFNPCCGKVINITAEQLEILHLNQNEKGRSM